MPRPAHLRAMAAMGIASVVALAMTACAPGGTPVADAADPEVIAATAADLGVAPDLVFTTVADGYELEPNSVGPFNVEGMSATWFDGESNMLTLRTGRGEMTRDTCADTPLEETGDVPSTCVEEHGVWHRSAGEAHEYVAVHGGALIRVSGAGVPAADLREAAHAVHVPSEAELSLLFSAERASLSGPVERGDIPENGDGAPIDPIGPGG